MKTILCISGSLREASSARAVLRAVTEALNGEARFVFPDIGLLPHYNADLGLPDSVASFIDAVGKADGVLIVTPEYNFSVPGVLKNAIDWASRPAYQSAFKGKPVFVISVSGGVLGGVRAQAHLKYILNGMLAEVFTCQEVVVPHAPKKMQDGVFTDEAVISFAVAGMRDFIASLTGQPAGTGGMEST